MISNDSIDIERLNPKRNQSEPRPILVKLNSTNLRADILKAAKLLKDQTEFKHISISPDLFKEQRLVQKKLIKMRKELNKEIKEHLPNAEFYFTIYNGKIVKRSKYRESSEKCEEMISDLLTEAISDFKTNQLNKINPTLISMPLLNKVINVKMKDIEHKEIIKELENITIHAINNLNNTYYWSECKIDKFERNTNMNLTALEENQKKLETELTFLRKTTKDIESLNALNLNKEITTLKTNDNLRTFFFFFFNLNFFC